MANAQKIIKLAAIFGALAVIIGAFGAHGLSAVLEEDRISIFETGVAYHFYHVLAMLLTGILAMAVKNKLVIRAAYLFMAGIICFSGSLYLLAISETWPDFLRKVLGPITPIGGLLFILGWISLFLGISTKNQDGKTI